MSTTRPMFRIGLLSTAHGHADDYARLLLRMPGVNLIGVFDEIPVRGSAFALRHRVTYFADPTDLFREGPDGVIVCAPNAMHRPLAEAAAAHGCAVLCEKPLATTLEDARAIIDACHRGNVPLMTAFPVRFSPAVQQAAALLHSGAIGALRALVGRNPSQIPDGWFTDRHLSGGGALMDHVVHLADLYRWLAREAPSEVYAVATTVFKHRIDAVETGGLLMLRYPSGAIGSIDCSWSTPRSHPTWGGLRIQMVSEQAVIEVDAFGQALEWYGEDPGHLGSIHWGSDMNELMIRSFVESVRDGTIPPVTGEDGYDALELTIAGYRSIVTGQPIGLR